MKNSGGYCIMQGNKRLQILPPSSTIPEEITIRLRIERTDSDTSNITIPESIRNSRLPLCMTDSSAQEGVQPLASFPATNTTNQIPTEHSRCNPNACVIL